MRKLIVMCLVCLTTTGCAVGNKYDYASGELALPIQGSGAVGLLVVDRRPYILSGDKPPTFVGLQRGGFGNPFNVETESGRPLALDMQDALENAMESRGFNVTSLSAESAAASDVYEVVRAAGLQRTAVLTLDEWKSDAMARFALSYAVKLAIRDDNGAAIASSAISGNKEVLGAAGFESSNAIAAGRVFAEKMNLLFMESEIAQALESGH